jgi:hypothetical protein
VPLPLLRVEHSRAHEVHGETEARPEHEDAETDLPKRASETRVKGRGAKHTQV